MGSRQNVAVMVLSGITGVTVASVSLLAYIRFNHPEQFADTSVKMSRPELSDEFTRKWGVYGTGIADSIPESVRGWFVIPNASERLEAHRRKREEQIRQTIEDLRPRK